MSCEFTDRDGSYVLGALSPAERFGYEQHLPGCTACARSVRELAGLPGLLSRVAPDVLEQPPTDVPVPVPDTVLPELLQAVQRERRRRSLAIAGLAAAAVAVAATAVGLSADRSGSGSPPATSAGRAMAPVGDVPVRARVALSSVTWGTRLDLTCTYGRAGERYHLPPAVTYALFVRTREGRTQQVGTWRALDGRTMRLTAATAAVRQDIASVEVRTTDGHPVLELPS